MCIDDIPELPTHQEAMDATEILYRWVEEFLPVDQALRISATIDEIYRSIESY